MTAKCPETTRLNSLAFQSTWLSDRRRYFPAVILATCLSVWGLAVHWSPIYSAGLWSDWSHPPPTGHVLQNTPHGFRWHDIKPSESLEFHPCFSSYQCARLSVPLNWNATTVERESGPRAVIAIIKLAAVVPVTHPQYGGAILLNPGGPGESGVYQVLSDGTDLRTILDRSEPPNSGNLEAAEGKYFDIVSFDPRGVNNTTPKIRCFPDAFNQQAWLLRYLDFGLLWDSDSIIGYEWARAAALGDSCSRAEADGGILPYANTAQVVEDMVEIIERLGEWRASEADRFISTAETMDSFSEQAIVQRTAYHRGQEKLQYWGMSYGTLIGSTFAAMHPDRVARIVLDGNVDPADHYSGGWLSQLQDSDTIITKFSEYCFRAGSEKCPLYTGSSPADVEARFTSIMLSLKTSPIPVPLPASEESKLGPELITYGDAHLHMLGHLYFSFSMAESFWDMLRVLGDRNTTSPELINIAAGKQAQLDRGECEEEESPTYPCVPYISILGPTQAISCMDAGGPPNITLEGFGQYLDVLKAQGKWISPSWARNKIGCLGYTVTPAWKPDLTFESQAWENTSHPLLIIGNSHDTVTPLRNAHRVSTLFPGSVVLQQDSEGHCSHSNPSLCTGKVVREYFQTGKLPPAGTICEPEMKPFVGCVRKDGCDFADSKDRKLWDSMSELADPFGLRKSEVRSEVHSEIWNQLLWHQSVLRS